MEFRLTNEQRYYLGLEPIDPSWIEVTLKGDSYRPESTIYFDGQIIKRHILSTQDQYKELQYEELTKDRKILLPKTTNGKEKSLTASVLESRKPIGVYVSVIKGSGLLIGNHTTQTTFYDSAWESPDRGIGANIIDLVDHFISTSNESHLIKINAFKNAKRKSVKFRSGDFFAFKLNRTEFGFGRVLININLLRKHKLLSEGHGLNYLMGPPVLIKFYAMVSINKDVKLQDILDSPSLPGDYIMDNLLLYGEYEILGNKELEEEEFNFPMSYGQKLEHGAKQVFFQWGLIQRELPLAKFDKYLNYQDLSRDRGSALRNLANPYGYYGIGFRSRFNALDIKHAIENGGKFDFEKSTYYMSPFDLRNPQNAKIRSEIMRVFGLNPNDDYKGNRELTNTVKISDLLNSK
jgi:hypothetical protein